MKRAVVVVARFTLAALAACAATPDESTEPKLVVASLDAVAYAAAVQPVVELRCGALDCHGSLPRGLRVYGKNGLRLANTEGRVPGVGETTPEEARATYDSIVGLQPELTNAVALKASRTEADAYSLLLLTKPTALERHRPGVSLRRGEPAERCIVSWVVGHVDASACTEGAKVTPR